MEPTHEGQTKQDIKAIPVIQELSSVAEWRTFLSTLEDFKGNLDNAALLMHQLSEGRSYVNKMYQASNPEFKPPLIVLVPGSLPSGHSPIVEVNKGEAIAVALSFLENISNLDIHDTMSITRRDGTVPYSGTFRDFWTLAGVEATDKSYFEQQYPNTEPGVLPGSISMAKYDARDIEFRSLQTQERYAREHQMQQVTIKKLQERLSAASSVRESKQNETARAIETIKQQLSPTSATSPNIISPGK